MQQMLLGMGGIVESPQLKVSSLNGSQVDISELSLHNLQDGDIIEPILADYDVVLKCGGEAGRDRVPTATSGGLPQSGLGAWVQGTINMKYGAKYCVRINDGIGAIYWGEINTDNKYCMMLGAQGGDGKRIFAGFYDSRFPFSADPNANGLGGNAGTPTQGSAGQGSPGTVSKVSATGGAGGTTNGYQQGQGGIAGTGTDTRDPGEYGGSHSNTDGGFFTKGIAVLTGGDSDGGDGGMGYYGGGAGGGINQGSGNAPRTGGGGGGGSSYYGGVPSNQLPNEDLDDATVTNPSSALNTGDTIDTAFVTLVSATKTAEKEERYWEGFEYGGAVMTFGGSPDDSPFAQRNNTGLRYGFYTRTGSPAVESGDSGGNNGIREREIVWDGELVHNTGNGSGTNVEATAPNANGWIVADGYAYSWVDIIQKPFPNSTAQLIDGITSNGQSPSNPKGSYYPWDGDQCNSFNVMRVEERYSELYTADEMRPIVIAARAQHIVGTAPNDSYPEHFTSSDPV